MSLDCPRETCDAQKARIKFYVSTTSNSFATVRDHVTLGGRRQDATTLEGLDVLRSIWHLLLDEPQPISAEAWEKVDVGTGQLPSHRALLISFEMTRGAEWPDVKVYVPVWRYTRSDDAVVANIEAIFRSCKCGSGLENGYGTAFSDVFKSSPKAATQKLSLGGVRTESKRPLLVHTDISFLHTRETGNYLTIYYTPYFE